MESQRNQQLRGLYPITFRLDRICKINWSCDPYPSSAAGGSVSAASAPQTRGSPTPSWQWPHPPAPSWTGSRPQYRRQHVLGIILSTAPPSWPPICPFSVWSSTTDTLNLSFSFLAVLAALSWDFCCPLSMVNLWSMYSDVVPTTGVNILQIAGTNVPEEFLESARFR